MPGVTGVTGVTGRIRKAIALNARYSPAYLFLSGAYELQGRVDDAKRNDVRHAYARGEHWNERIAMMQWWVNYLDELKGVHSNVSNKVLSPSAITHEAVTIDTRQTPDEAA